MGNEGNPKVTCLGRARYENINQSPAAEPAPAKAATITVDDANHTARAIVVTAINHHKMDWAAEFKPVAPLPPVYGNTNNPDLRRPARGWLKLNASVLRMITHSYPARNG